MPASTKDMANAIRFLSADAVQKANSGHPGMPMGMADVATVLFTRYLKFDAAQPAWPDRDRFVLSAGHGSMLLYSLLYLTGYEGMTIEQIKDFRQFGSLTPGHPEYRHTPGVETTTGPLGQGITTAVGMALAERMMNARFGDDLVGHYTYVIAGDGCLMEGISQEAISLAGHLKLGRLIVLWDDNKISIDGATSKATSEDQLERFAASGWDVESVDAYDAEAVAAAIGKARGTASPSLIACRSVIAYGAPTKAGTHAAHGSPLGEPEIEGARKALGWTSAPFEVPGDVLAAWRKAGGRGKGEREAWEARLAKSGQRDEFERLAAHRLPDGWKARLAEYRRKLVDDKPKWATRKCSGEALEVLTAAVPEMIGGSADLTGSVNTLVKATAKAITPQDFSGRYIHYGVREHAMGAVMNGLALHGGFIPYSGTFLVFADYMRGAMRLSALMGAKVVYVLTHDSIGVGEDGPTHQPVETLASLRCLPGFRLFRPADAVEAAECWELAVEGAGPCGMVCSRQAVPALRTTHIEENRCARGGYVLAEAEGGARKVTLLSTGTELHLAVAAREALQAEGIPTAVVSMPCWALFDAQDAAYRQSVLGAAGGARVAVEAALEFGWSKYLGDRGAFVGMTGFGASAPAEILFEHFGITAAKVVAAAKALI